MVDWLGSIPACATHIPRLPSFRIQSTTEVAGPDFPTSVLCGILRLNIPQMLLGRASVIKAYVECFCGLWMPMGYIYIY